MPAAQVVKNRKATPWCSKKDTLPLESFKLKKWGCDVLIKSSISDVEEVWDKLALNESFAKEKYLKTLESTNPDHLNNLYVILLKDEKPIAAVLLQSLVLNLSESFDYDNYSTNKSAISRMWQRIRQMAISFITFRMLTVGNLYLTGQYGIFFEKNLYSKNEEFQIINDLLKVLKKELCNTPYRFSGILFKDYFDHQCPDEAKHLNLYSFEVDPNMILPLRSSWLTFDDYLLDMKSKYRVRLKNAIKKFKGIERKVLSLEEVEAHNDRMYSLYNQVLDGSGFVLAMGKENYFLELKRQLQDDLNVTGYFLDGEMIGFYTWVLEDAKIDSHFIGFNYTLNNKHQIYLNILLDLVRDGIEQKASSIYYFRTALEIKSSVGAEPKDMAVYFKHTNWFLAKYVVPIAFKYFVPKQTWKQRHPFKT